MTIITRFSVAIASTLLVACVSGTDVFQVPPDAGPIECERPATPHVRTEFIRIGPDVEPGDGLRGACVPPPLEVSSEGFVDCQVMERRLTECSTLPGRTRVRDEIDDLGTMWHVCELAQVSRDGEVGWRHERAVDLGSDSEVSVMCGWNGERLALAGFTVSANTSFDLSCALSGPSYANGLGARCGLISPEEWGYCGFARRVAAEPIMMTCDSVTNRCAVPCTSDTDCADAGIIGEVCAERGVCVIPGCFAP